jgi:hypothetical protein
MSRPAYTRYSFAQPIGTHMRPATCEEVDCAPFLKGWRVPLAAVTEAGFADLAKLGYRFTRVELGPGQGYLEFEAGQPCFSQLHPDRRHRVLIGRAPLFRRDGYLHSTAESWIDDFATNQDRLNTFRERYG